MLTHKVVKSALVEPNQLASYMHSYVAIAIVIATKYTNKNLTTLLLAS